MPPSPSPAAKTTSNPSSRKLTILLALSGPSSSGKTTLARLLHKTIFPRNSTRLIHLDDFYRPESELPRLPADNGGDDGGGDDGSDLLLDWDSAGSLDLPHLQRTLEYVSAHGGALPPGFSSKEDSNAVGAVPVSDAVIEQLARDVGRWWDSMRVGEWVERIVLVDGFLLVGRSIPRIRELFDARLLLRASFADAKRRREARQGYVTLEGWWEDPPGYVERVVWPAFVEEHGFLFEGGDVEGLVNEDVVGELGIDVGPMGDLESALRWVVDVVKMRVMQKVDEVRS